MDLSDVQYKALVAGAGLVLALGIGSVRFCGSVSLPPKPAVPVAQSSSSSGEVPIVAKQATSPTVYLQGLQQDAALAGVRTPTIEEMSKKLVYRVDEARHVLGVGAPAIDLAGLRLVALHNGDAVVLDVLNTTDSDLAYFVQSQAVPNIPECATVAPIAFNAMVIEKRSHEARVECAYRNDMSIVITKVETMELPPLMAWNVAHVPPSLVGVDDRIARGHRIQRDNNNRCSGLVSQAVIAGVESHEIGWRDLVDFYARHRCQSYQFPPGYRAFTADNQKTLPVDPNGM